MGTYCLYIRHCRARTLQVWAFPPQSNWPWHRVPRAPTALAPSFQMRFSLRCSNEIRIKGVATLFKFPVQICRHDIPISPLIYTCPVSQLLCWFCLLGLSLIGKLTNGVLVHWVAFKVAVAGTALPLICKYIKWFVRSLQTETVWQLCGKIRSFKEILYTTLIEEIANY